MYCRNIWYCVIFCYNYLDNVCECGDIVFYFYSFCNFVDILDYMFCYCIFGVEKMNYIYIFLIKEIF